MDYRLSKRGYLTRKVSGVTGGVGRFACIFLALLLGALALFPIPVSHAQVSDLGVVVWGYTDEGIGDVPAPNSGFTAVDGGYAHSLGLKLADGSIVAWGSNSDSQCSPIPGDNSGFSAVAAGGWHSLGLKFADGRIVAWGSNGQGQCSVPAPNSGFSAIAAGNAHSLGIKAADGRIVAWGNNGMPNPIPAPNSGFTAVAAGAYHDMGLKSDGSIVDWDISSGTVTPPPGTNAGFSAVAAGGSHSLGLKSADGSIVAWGSNSYGQCDVPSPNNGFVAVAAGGDHSLGLKADGSIVAWGYNDDGENDVPAGSDFSAVGAGDYHSLALNTLYTITATATGNGSITPSGAVSVVQGADQVFTITPDTGYHLTDVEVDSVSQGPITTYTFEDIDDNHSIEATFAPDNFNITASVFYTGHGSVNVVTPTVNYGDTATIDLIPATGYHVVFIMDNGAAVTIADPYYIYNVTEAHNIIAFFDADAVQTYTINVGTSGNGSVVKSPDQPTYDQGTSVRLTAVPEEGYHFVEWAGDLTGSANPANVTMDADKNITAVFAPDVLFYSYFAEGYTGEGFQEYLCLGNPGTAAANAVITYILPDGTTQTQELSVAADSRSTVDVNTMVGADKNVSIEVQSDQQIVVERPMYFDYKGEWTGGSDVIGAAATSDTFYFAEGYTGEGFDEYLCVLNPGDVIADLTFDFQTQEEGPITKTGYSVGPHTRGTFKVNDVLGTGYQTSLKLESTQPVVAERPMYFNYNGEWTGGHCVMGASSLSRQYYFAEGTTRSNFQEYLTLQNPGTTAIEVNAVYQLGAGQGGNIERAYTIGAGERATVFVPDEVGAEKDVSVTLTSAAEFLAERPMYFNYQDEWTGGHCVIGASAPGSEWLFAEGYTGAGFDEWLCLQNPGTTESTVEITYLAQETGALPVKTLKVPAGSRSTVLVNTDAGEGYQLSVKVLVTAGGNVVVERPMYFDYNGWTGGHDAVGYRP